MKNIAMFGGDKLSAITAFGSGHVQGSRFKVCVCVRVGAYMRALCVCVCVCVCVCLSTCVLDCVL